MIEGQPTGCVRVSFGFASTTSDVINVIEFIENCFVQGREKIDVKRQYDQLTQKTKSSNAQIRNFTSTVTDSELWKVKDVHLEASREIGANNLSVVCNSQIDAHKSSDSESCDEFYDAETEVTKDDAHVDADTKVKPQSVEDDDQEDDIVLEKIIIYPVKSCAGFEVKLTNRLN